MFPLINPITVLQNFKTAGWKMILYAIAILIPFAVYYVLIKFFKRQAVEKSDSAAIEDLSDLDKLVADAQEVLDKNSKIVDQKRKTLNSEEGKNVSSGKT